MGIWSLHAMPFTIIACLLISFAQEFSLDLGVNALRWTLCRGRVTPDRATYPDRSRPADRQSVGQLPGISA
jgi:hypothetical protein